MGISASSSSSSDHWYRAVIRGKTRIALAWVFALILVFSAQEYPQWPGILVCFLGATLRFLASGYLKKDTRPATGGPYAFTRNPLYLGTFLMAIGTAWAIQNLLLLGLVVVAFFSVYHFIILDEEDKLKELFGEPYLKYQYLVPRFFPRTWHVSKERLAEVNPDAVDRSFSWRLAMKNKAFEAYWSFIGLIGFVTLLAYLWKTL